MRTATPTSGASTGASATWPRRPTSA